ncbi:MAG: GreA/GreB family elongation factor, partial [Spirochaetales bacterium]|nr:GreA/GreB family elongation factor [Candidatus Physcosoma equi]
LKAIISSKYPSFDFGEKDELEEEKPMEISVVRGFLCTKKSFEAQQAQLKDIKEVQLPHTLKEINDARELGDLRENSEYQYAKDHKRFLDKEYERIATELGSVKIMAMKDVIDGLVGFGTKVTIQDNKNNKTICYTFFGRWESDPDNNVIDINAPIGEALINHKEGDNVTFTIGGNPFDYTIVSIEKVAF